MPSYASLVSGIAAVATAAMLSGVDAHGFVSQPKPQFVPNKMYTDFNAEFTAADTKIAAFQGKIFNHSPEDNTKVFTAAFKDSGLKSLRELMDKYVEGCGNTDMNTTPRDVSALKTLTFQNNEYKEGFLGSHHGPCEIWFDDTRVFQNDDCAGNFKGYPATIPVDYSKCQGKCKLTFYWLALHSQKWQAYKQCVPIQNGSGSGAVPAPTSAPPSAGEASSAPAPGPTTTKSASAAPAPAPSTAAPSSAPSPSSPVVTPAPAPAPAPTSAAPAPKPTKKCTTRRSRRALQQDA